MQYVLLFVLLALTWGLVLLPQQRRVKAHRAFVASLQVGDEVITTAGTFGTITHLESDRLRLRIAPDVEVTVARLAIGRSRADLDALRDADRAVTRSSPVTAPQAEPDSDDPAAIPPVVDDLPE